MWSEVKFNAKMGLVLFCVFSAAVTIVAGAGLNEEFTWTRLNYAWPSADGNRPRRAQETEARSYVNIKRKDPEAIFFEGLTNTGNTGNTGNPADITLGNNNPGFTEYQYENNIPMGANVWQNKLFITVPRRRVGVPSTLNYVPLNSREKQNAPLIPYPNWNMNLYPDSSNRGENFVSVYRVAVDTCDRLWFVDTGIIEIPGNWTHVKPTTLVVMDLQTDTVIQRHVIPSDYLRSVSSLASITVDASKETCGDAFAYLPDLAGYGLIVYSLRQNRSWRVAHNYFYVESLAGEFNIAGHNFQWSDGIFSVELTDTNREGFRDMYFHSLAGTHIFKVSTKILKNETLATRSYHGNDFQNLGDRGELSQTSTADLHKSSGTLFLGLINQNGVGCWNIAKPLNTISVIQKDDRRMVYPSDVKIYNDKVYVLTNTMPEFLYGRLNYDIINFRVWSNTVKDAVRGTPCASGR